ncbi:hypothetical protein H0H93_009929 [Arthromyces matolae]|nr:hypothetical protein H0H93_009929 [Arthromyces matolae]
MFSSRARIVQTSARRFISNLALKRSSRPLPPRLNVSVLTAIPRRNFIASSKLCTIQTESEAKPQENDSQPDSEKWISILENTVSAPWLFSTAKEDDLKLTFAYTLLFQIVLYLWRPEGEQFLTAFATAPASTESEIGRARKAIPVILRAAVHQMSSLPLTSPIRTEHPDLFDVFGALQTIHDTYLKDDIVDIETWSEFWSRTQPVIVDLGTKLNDKGFGLPADEMEGEQKEQEKP